MPSEIDITQNAMFRWGEQRGIEQGVAQGIARGVAHGLALGVAQGEERLLLKLLEHEFGTPPADLTAKTSTATVDQLERWTEGSFEGAATLTSIFAD